MSLVLQSPLPYPHSCQGTSPHQQGWDTKMAMLSFCGVDVSKDRLDVVGLPEGWFFSVSNDTAGWAELVARLRPLTVSAIGLEPSGGYEGGVIRALPAAGRRCSNGCAPSQSRRLALSRAVVTSAGSSVPCSRRGCRCDVSTRTSFVSSPAPAACWPRTTASMRG